MYKDKFKDLGISAVDSAAIISSNAALRNLMGFVNGPLLRTYGFRKVAVAASLVFSFGLMMTSFSNTVLHFIVSYGLVTCKYLSSTFTFVDQ